MAVSQGSTTVRRPTYRYQRTIQHSVRVQGTGYVTGATVSVRFVPAPPSTGIVFVRTDLGPKAFLPATVDHVTGTLRRTTLGSPPLYVTIVEHVLASLAGLRIEPADAPDRIAPLEVPRDTPGNRQMLCEPAELVR